MLTRSYFSLFIFFCFVVNSSASMSSKCLVKIQHSLTNYTFKTVHCYSFCCTEGCCTWYITLFVYAALIIILASFWLFIIECWLFLRNYKKSTSQSEVVLMTPTSSRSHQTYGTNSSQVTLHILPTVMLAHVVPKKKTSI